MAKYTIIPNEYGSFDIKEKTKTHSGVRWITISNYIDECNTLEEAKRNIPKQKYLARGVNGLWVCVKSKTNQAIKK